MIAEANLCRVKSRLAFSTLLLCASCHPKPAPVPAGPASASSASTPVDRLAPNELAAGTADIWGFPVPRDMHIESNYHEVAYLSGAVKPDALSNYVRDRVIVSHVEIGAGRTIFPDARIKGGAPDHVYELDVVPEAGRTELVIHDLTPPKVLPGLTDAQRWQQAGLTPEGRPLDMKKFE